MGCYTPVKVCRMRATRLDDVGAPLPGSDSVVVTDALITLGYSVVLKTGANFEQQNGCGDVCATVQDPDQVKAVDLKMDLCKLDHELVELLTGATLVQVLGQTRGFVIPQVDTPLTSEVSIEAWAKAWDGDQQAVLNGQPMYYRYVFPRTTWVLGDQTLENKVITLPMSGHGKSNSQFGDGPANDLPYDVYLAPMGIFDDDSELPDATCGYTALVAS